MKYQIIALIFLFSCLDAFSASQTDSIVSQSDTFFKTLKEEKIDEAIDNLFKDTAMGKQTDKLNYLKSQIKSTYDIYGKPTGYSFISSQPFGDSIYKVYYSLNFKVVPLIWTLFFYKTDSGWKISNIDFNDQFRGL
jgi:hypothetical protein